jgi:tetratricopeptide (TPR) repeat protein
VGTCCFYQARADEAREHWEVARELAREMGNQSIEAGTTVNLGNVHVSQGRLTEARDHYERGLRLCRAIGHRRYEAIATGQLSNVLKRLGFLDEAREHAERSHALHREVGNRSGEAIALAALGNLLTDAGDFEAARDHAMAVLSLSQEIGQRHLALVCYVNLGDIARELGDQPLAWEWAARGIVLADELQLIGLATWARCLLATRSPEDLRAAEAAHAEAGPRLDNEERLGALWLLWLASGNRQRLLEARRVLDEIAASVPEEVRSPMLTKVRTHREILEACARLEPEA